MKTLIKIIIVAVLAGVTFKYLEERNISVSELLSGTIGRISRLIDELEETPPAVTEEARTADVNRSGLTPLDVNSGNIRRTDEDAAVHEADLTSLALNSDAIEEVIAAEYAVETGKEAGYERFQVLDRYAVNTPPHAEESIESLVNWLMKSASSELDRARLIFTWIATHVGYDDHGFNTGNYSETSPEGVFRNRVSVCQGYAELFTRMCSLAGIEAYTITGYAKGITYRRGQPINDTNHAWNVALADGEWRLFDVTWGAGYGTAVRGQLVSVSEFNDFWFDVSPADCIFSHLPEDNRWQLMVPAVTLRQFETMPYVSALFFKMGFSGKQCLREYLNGTISTLPRAYMTSSDIRVVSLPWSGTLEAGEVIMARVIAGEGIIPAYKSGGRIIKMEPDGETYCARIRLEPGEFALMITTGGGSYETVLEYVVE